MNEIKQSQSVVRHEFCVKDRRMMTITGVKEILSFDEQSVRLLTVGGELAVDGEDMRVKVLDVEKGNVALEGRIDNVGYLDAEQPTRRGFWSRFAK